MDDRPPIEIVRAEPHHEAEILALATRTLGWEDDPRFVALYRWKHDENPVGPSPRWVALSEGTVVGFRVLLRWRFVTPEGHHAEAVRAVDTATDPAFQGRGIFRSLTLGAIEALAADGIDLVFNTPNDQSRPGYLKMGWTELGKPPVALVPRARSLPRIAKSRVPADLWSQPCAVGVAAGAWFADPAHEAMIEAWGTTDTSHCWHTDRTPAWLTWRYGLDHLQYRVTTTDELGIRTTSPGLAVFRLRRRGPSLEATITEVAAPDPGVRRRLLRGVLRATGADYALVSTSTRVDLTPSLALSTFSPLVTWRRLSELPQPELSQVRLTVGDLELF